MKKMKKGEKLAFRTTSSIRAQCGGCQRYIPSAIEHVLLIEAGDWDLTSYHVRCWRQAKRQGEVVGDVVGATEVVGHAMLVDLRDDISAGS